MPPKKPSSTISSEVITRELVRGVSSTTSRSSFFQSLSRLIKQQFSFDRLCINLYDPNSELISFFAAAEGTVVNALSPTRKAEKVTVAGHVISTGKPVVITDIAQHFTESMQNPLAEAGLRTTMAFPLILNDDIIGTIHCSFVQKPENLYTIMEFFLEISPYVAICIGALIAIEQNERGIATNITYSSDLSSSQEDFIYVNPRMRQVMKIANKLARLEIPVLLLGETGTGKSHLANVIHSLSNRHNNIFVHVNCPAIASSLFESEFFGHAKGAFTGAASSRVGRLELAQKGTLFLDEIAELSLEMQSKILHVLDYQSFQRVGESISIPVQTRIIAATNIDVERALKKGKLRQDFYYRLSTYILEIPPLRERPEDIPVLSRYFINELSSSLGLPKITLSDEINHIFLDHHWPGNIRELKNIINQILVNNFIHNKLDSKTIKEMLLMVDSNYNIQKNNNQTDNIENIDIKYMNLQDVERRHIKNVLHITKGVISGPKGAATLLGLPRSTLHHKMRKLGICVKTS